MFLLESSECRSRCGEELEVGGVFGTAIASRLAPTGDQLRSPNLCLIKIKMWELR